jgi:hypothetical protein
MLTGRTEAGVELAVPEHAPEPASPSEEVAVQHVVLAEPVDAPVVAEVLAARAQVAAARAEAERLRERVRVLESWVAAAAQGRKVEYVQAQRLAMMKAVERDERFTFVLSLPLALLVLYCGALVVLVWLLLDGRI